MNIQQPPLLATRQTGLVMISALLLLLVATILAATMFRSFGTQEKIAGNLREKERAIHAAVTAQQWAENFLQSGNAPLPGVCKSPAVDSGAAVVCSNQLSVAARSDPSLWPGGVNYIPPDPTSGGGLGHMNVTTTTGPGTYFAKPTFYISDLGPAPASIGGGELYQINAMASGGTADTLAVVESVYQVIQAGPGGGRPGDTGG